MAFYFALFNVSNVNQELRGQRKAREREVRERRRHSLAASVHLAKDYKLLPKPRIVLHDHENDTVTTSLDETTTDESTSSRPAVGMSTAAFRRASSPETRWHQGENSRVEPANVRGTQSKHVKFNSPAGSRERLEKSLFATSQADAEVWVRRDAPGEPRDDNPWVYSVDLKRRIFESRPPTRISSEDRDSERRRLSSSSDTTSDNERRTSLNVSTEALLGPMENLSTSTLDQESNIRPPANKTPSSSVWRRRSCAMGVSGLELRSTSNLDELRADEERRLQEDLRRHVNTWPAMRGNRSRWRPTSLIRRHSGGGAADLSSMFQRSRRPLPYHSMTTPPSPEADLLSSPLMTETTKIVKSAVVNSAVVKKSVQRPLVITPTDRRANPSVSFRGGLSTLAAQLSARPRPPDRDSRIAFVRLNDAANLAASPSTAMVQSSIF